MISTALSRTRLIAAAVGLACLPGLACAAAIDTPRIGAATTLKGQVTAVIDSQPAHSVKTGEEVYGGERIRTGPGSSLIVEFLDNSTFQIGANADVVINPSQVQPVAGTTVRSVQVNAGSFRSITALGSTNSQTIISTSAGAFTSSAGVVVGEVSAQRVVIFPIDGPGTFVYSANSISVPKGGALVADLGTGQAHAIQTVATDPAVSQLMAEAMSQLGTAAPVTAQAGASAPVGYVAQPTGAVAGIATTADGYIDTSGGTESKEEIPPQTEVAAVGPPPPQPPPQETNVTPPPLPPPIPSTITP
jgi:hypothetical protein